jgi:hypothetical protein
MSNSTGTLRLFMKTHFYDRIQTIPGLFFLRRVWSVHLWLGLPSLDGQTIRSLTSEHVCRCFVINVVSTYTCKVKIISLELHIFWWFCYLAICFRVLYVLEVNSSVSSPLSLSFLHAVLLKSRAHIRLGAMVPPLLCTIYVVLNLPHRVVL